MASVFIVNGVIIVSTIKYNNDLSRKITMVMDPSMKSLQDLKLLLILSREYSINWVFLRSYDEYKSLLKRSRSVEFPALKSQLTSYSEKWNRHEVSDSLQSVFKRHEEVLLHQKEIMRQLARFEDYDDPATKFSAESVLEDEVIPRTNAEIASLEVIISIMQDMKSEEEAKLSESSQFLKVFIMTLALTIIVLAIILSRYMGKIIVQPINKIIAIVNDLGKGITKKVDYSASNDEIGKMINSVNNLSDKLHASAVFAKEVGKRNFDIDFVPLSSEDTLGQALLTMRNSLRSSDESLNEAQRVAQLGSWDWDVRTGKIIWSDELYRIMDIRREAYIPTYNSVYDFIHPADREYVRSIVSQCAVDNLPYAFECRLVTKRGQEKMIYVKGQVTLDEKSNIVKMYGIIQDITHSKLAQQKLEEAHKQLQTLFTNIDEVFFTVDMVNNKVLQISPACEKIYGYKEESFYENSNLWQEVVLPEDMDQINRNYPEMLAGNPFAQEYRITHKDGNLRWIETKITPTLDATGKLVRIDGVTADTTKRREDEEILKANLAELRKTNMELDKFVYSVSHDLRAPLLSMQGVIEITAEETTEEATGEYMKMLQGSVRRLDILIGDILEYSRNARTEVKIDTIDFEKLLGEITLNLKYANDADNRVKINIDVKSDEVFVSDKHRISAILNNLISNAVRYNNPGAENPYVNVMIHTMPKETLIEVSDNGIGIKEEFHQRVFEMFYRGSESSIGSGLGLYIVKESIIKLQGTINVESKPGEGTKFSLVIQNLLYQ
jgi:PAS domain S-box-containing protein